MNIGISDISLDLKEKILEIIYGFLMENMTEPMGSPDTAELARVAEYLNFDTSIWYSLLFSYHLNVL
jgi:hypothetical protein